MNETEVEKNPLATEKISKLIRKFSIPCIISLLVSSLYNIVDQVFIGQKVGYLGNAATNVVFPITVIATAVALLIGDGAAAFLSLCLGKNDNKSAEKGINTGIILITILGLLFLAIGLIFKEPLLRLFGATDNIWEYACDYMFYIVLGLPFYMITTTMNSMIRADGSPKYAMKTMLTGAIINVILDPIAIFKLNAGVAGAAIATVIGQIATCVLSFLYIKKFKTVRVNKETLRIDYKVIKKICALGVSSFITQMAITVVMVISNNALTKYGAMSKYGAEIPLSALGIVMKVNQIITSILVGIAVGAQPIIGFNYGAKKYGRVTKTYSLAIKMSLVVTVIGTLIFQFAPQLVISLFGQENELYNEFAKMCFRIFLMFLMLNGVQVVSSIFLQAIGKSVKSAILSLSRQILILIPVTLILPIFFGVNGVLYAGPVADMLAFLITIAFISVELKNIKKMDETKEPEIVEKEDTKLDNQLIITIGREFGSGGKYIGEQLAKHYNIKLYDNELLKRVSNEENIDMKLLEEADEKQKSSFWYTMAMSSLSTTDSVNSLTDLPSNDAIFIKQAKVIEEIAEKESCVIIGRCSNRILKDNKNVINVFIYATDMDFKIARKMQYANLSKNKAEKLILKNDKERANYYNYYTNEKWGDRSGYDLFIDTSKIGVDNAVELIEEYVEIQRKKEHESATK